jgi:hypothetical protein
MNFIFYFDILINEKKNILMDFSNPNKDTDTF